MWDYKKIFKNREFRLKLIEKLKFIPDKPYLKFVYKIKTGQKLNFKNPVGFAEKLNWLKIYDRHPEHTKLVDKLAVREHIANLIGDEHLIPLLGSWEHFDDIDFDTLPNEFVLKCNHDSGSVKIISDKNSINKKELKAFFEGRLKINPYYIGREYPYKNVKPCIIAEKLMRTDENKGITDYKFFCFDGVPKIIDVISDRFGEHCESYYDINFNKLDVTNSSHKSDKIHDFPEKLEEMIAIAKKLSEGIKFVRIDLYEINSHIYFGEYTFYEAGGFWLFKPESFEKELGTWIKL